MNDFEIKLGGFTFKGVYLAIFIPLLSSISAGIWYVSDFYNRIEIIESVANDNSNFSGNIENLQGRVSLIEQSIQDNDIASLQGKLAELGTNLTLIMEAQKELLDLKDKFKDIEVSAKENALLVESYQSRIKELERKINIYQKEINDIWKAMDALSNPLG